MANVRSEMPKDRGIVVHTRALTSEKLGTHARVSSETPDTKSYIDTSQAMA